ncbi:LacI family DNA-binding transcriptional regulator [Falsiroseomonas selenitidurans]|uniref:LacI family transcriptional regulator n=1 Tax=Falsiroseomonas selenitidurans TaxID=2716335 RepID=A0ABX1E4C3_9PROT|nr:LacI family DNA-binding transcriptional regulator [Falsiroseomonas selenitidurans]NKC32026.1 LacI family transcriptional regulator [Falsiroseomonas selenitidurans]
MSSSDSIPGLPPGPAPRATIADVAREAGVHASTVSRALNPATRGMVTEGVAQRVAEAAERLGWRPSALAAGLRTRKSRTIGILVPDLVNPIFPPILHAVETLLAGQGYATLMANTANDPAREALLIERMATHLVDGLMLASAAAGTGALDLCARFGIPAVLINRRMPAGCGATSAVTNDDHGGIGLAVAHLLALGHRRIAHLAGPEGISTAMDRLSGFRDALAAQGLDPDAAPILHAGAYTAAAGQAAMAALLAGPRFTAVAVANDMLCLGTYDALAAAGLRVAADVSVTGFNDMPFVDRICPALTTVRIQHAAMGRQAAEILLAEMADPALPRRDIRLVPELVCRASTAPPNPDAPCP